MTDVTRVTERAEAVGRGDLSAHIARRIIVDARADGVAPGQPLVGESRLIERYGVSGHLPTRLSAC